MNDPIEWGPERRSRAHVVANITIAICVALITVSGVLYMLGGAR